jgi:hypothetical protein
MIPAFIVEGRAEQKILQKICPGAKVIILECNGDSVNMTAIAKKISSLYRLFGNRFYPVNVIFDREKRNGSYIEIQSELKGIMADMNMDCDQFRIGVADRTLETWLLYAVSDRGGFNASCSSARRNEFEGALAEGELARRLKLRGINYHKTTIGVDLFSRIHPKALAAKSDSFRDYVDKIDFGCRWLMAGS